MANAPLGNSFPEGVLGVCRIDYDNLDMGKTDGNTEIKVEYTDKEIRYAQDGTDPADHIPTGCKVTVTANIADITTARLGKIWFGITVQNNSAKISRNLYTSKRAVAKPLKLTRIDSEGIKSTDPVFICNFYKASAKITSGFVYGADVQRNLTVEWYIYFDDTLDGNNNPKGYGYWGYPSSVDAVPV